MTEKEFISPIYSLGQDSGSTSWKAPSNIALIKYWGKKPLQIPANPSLSFTLDASATTTTLSYSKSHPSSGDFSFDIYLDNVPEPSFRPKIDAFFKRILPYLPFLREYHFTIETSNSFPHSSGIASSASGMAALALCLMDLERQVSRSMDEYFFAKKASFLARLGSGSASRSIHGPLMQWGKYKNIAGSSDLYAISYPLTLHKVFRGYKDTILLVDKGQKQVSSSLGHGLMNNHLYGSARHNQALSNLETLIPVLSSGDLEGFIKITELEALSLHAMMMTSQPYFILMKPNTLEIIQHIWDFRQATGIPLCFTLDAGANVHLLYPEEFSAKILVFIKDVLVKYCQNKAYICDQIGIGAKKM